MLLKFNAYNIYDRILFVIVFSLVFGNFGNALQIVRIIALLLLPKLVQCYSSSKILVGKYIKVFICFLLYASLSLLWTNDFGEGVKAVVYYVVHFLIFIEIIVFSRFANNPLRSLSSAWVVSVFVTLFIAFWEIWTDNHLGLSKFDSDLTMTQGQNILQVHFASVTFGNYNGYVTYLCFAFPFLFYYLSTSSKALKPFTLIVIMMAFATILYNASRGGLVAFVIMVLFYSLRPPKLVFKVSIIIIALLVVAPFLIENGSDIFLVISARAEDGGLFEDSERTQLIKDSLTIFINSLGFGVGVSGLPGALKEMGSFVTIPHNMFLELLVEFGAVFFLMFVLYIINLFLDGRKNPIKDCRIVTLLFIIALPFFSVIDSVYLLNPIVYVGFACLTVFSRIRSINQRYLNPQYN